MTAFAVSVLHFPLPVAKGADIRNAGTAGKVFERNTLFNDEEERKNVIAGHVFAPHSRNMRPKIR